MARTKVLKMVNLISGGASTCLRVIEEERSGGTLFGVTETVGVIASSDDVAGIENLKETDFPAENIHVANPSEKYFTEKLLDILHHYNPEAYHQLGWMPQTPEEVIEEYTGLNQHLGPGGRWMYGVRRVYAHMRFCQEVQRIMPISVFCQFVDPIYDAGKIVFLREVDLDWTKTPEQNAEMLLSIEHAVQIAGRLRLFYGFMQSTAQSVPNIAKSTKEEEIIFAMKAEARDKYPPDA